MNNVTQPQLKIQSITIFAYASNILQRLFRIAHRCLIQRGPSINDTLTCFNEPSVILLPSKPVALQLDPFCSQQCLK